MITTLSLDPRYDQLMVSLKQIDALFAVATSADMTDLTPEVLSHYFWIGIDLLTKTKEICNDLGNITYSQPIAGE